MRAYVLVLAVIAFTGCASIDEYERIVQKTDQPLITHIGGQMLKIERTSDLPNAFGRADVWGGKVNRGFTELRYQGLSADGRYIFRVTEVETESNETTMSRYMGRSSTVNATQVGNSVYGTVTTYEPEGSTERLPPNTVQFALEPSKANSFVVAGIEVQVTSADETSVNYKLRANKTMEPTR